MSRRPNLVAHTTAYTALALVLITGLTGGFNPSGPPSPSGDLLIHRRPATPAESLRHQLEQAWLMDEITAGRR